MKERLPDAPADARITALADCTTPSEDEVARLLASRPSRADAELRARLAEAEQATAPNLSETWSVRRVPTGLMPRDPRAIGWSRATAPTEHEAGRIVSVAPEPTLAGDTEPLPHEIAGVVRGRVPAAWSTWTAPTDLEVQRLIASRPDTVPTGARSAWLVLSGGLLALGTVATALFVALQPAGYGAPDLPVGQLAVVESAAVYDLGPSIDLMAHTVADRATPTVRVAQADARGTVVDVLDGGTRFEVHPQGRHRELTVRAGDISVFVRGTIFTVDHLDDRVQVGVERGQVEVRTPERTFYLTAGQRWSSLEDDATAAVDALMLPTDAPKVVIEPEVAPEPEPQAVIRSVPMPRPPAKPVEAEPSVVEPAVAEPTVAEPTMTQAPEEPVVDAPDEPVVPETAPRAPYVPLPAAVADLGELQALQRRDRQGDPPAALIRDIDRFLAADPDGRLLNLALDLRLHVARRSGQPVRIVEALDRLLTDVPDTAGANRLHLERASLHHALGRCDLASASYRHAAELDGTDGIHALIGLGACARAMGDPGAARMAFELAQSRRPPPELATIVRSHLSSLPRRKN